ncbi:MAG: hypothetical protein QNJ40_20760 [Xanthomonadales bacterium]|nr:hypothetical protein [Xanthomonadales bacterium]
MLRFARDAWLVMMLCALAAGPVLGQSAKDLLDRGTASSRTEKGTTPTATLAIGGGTPGVTIGAIMAFLPPANPGTFAGHLFSPGVEFPTSYHPFTVTGAYAWGGPPILGSPILGAGVFNAPQTDGSVTWQQFTSMATTFGPFSPGMIYGTRAIFGGIQVLTGQGVACGFDPGVAGAVLGAITAGVSKNPILFTNMGGTPATGSIFAATVNTPGTYVAGCYITGATVPVELQSFSVD